MCILDEDEIRTIENVGSSPTKISGFASVLPGGLRDSFINCGNNARDYHGLYMSVCQCFNVRTGYGRKSLILFKIKIFFIRK